MQVKAYLVKYTLRTGYIEEVYGQVLNTPSKFKANSYPRSFTIGIDIAFTREAAVQIVEGLKKRRIKFLKAQIDRIKKLQV